MEITNRSQMSRRRDNETAKNKAETHELADRKRRHLPAAERERQIVEAAASFFAERGFEGQTRELAKTMALRPASSDSTGNTPNAFSIPNGCASSSFLA
jgi:hypothetical protein